MKRYVQLVFIILATLLVFILGNNVMAATTDLSVKSTEVTVGENINVTVTLNAAQWDLALTANGETIGSWVETVNYKENLSKTFTASYKTTKEGTVTFVLKGDITDVDQTNSEINTTKSVTVKAQANNNNSSGGNTGNSGSTSNSGGSTTQPTKPTFTSTKKTVYTTRQANLRSSWSTSSSATSVEKGTELTLTGTSTETVNGHVWYRVEYKGSTKYIANFLVSSTKPKEEEKSANNNLSSLEIEGITLAPEFSKDVLQYTAEIADEETTKLEVNVKTEDSKAKVEVEGNEELKNGENTIKIIVTAEDNTTKTYTVKVTKGEDAAATTAPTDGTLKLSELQIGGVDFEDGFDPDLYSYELTLNIAVNNLAITAKANQEDAKIEIVGNENFIEGQNIIMILLTSADGTQSATYQIKVNMPSTATETQDNLHFYLICAGVAIAVIILLAIIVGIRRRKNRDDEFLDEEELEADNIAVGTNSVEEDTEKEEDRILRKKASLDEFLDTSEIEAKPRRSKGKHSV